MNDSRSQNPGCLGGVLRLFGLRAPAQSLPYRLQHDFLSPGEVSFYQVLSQVAGERAVVCPKVRLSDVFFVAAQEGKQGYRNRIDRKHVDFLLCQPGSMRPLAGVDLDDASHTRPDRQERDDLVDAVFAAAGLPLLRVSCSPRGYNTRELAAQLAPYLEGQSVAPARVAVSAVSAGPGSPSCAPVMTAPSSTPLCPKCGVPMVVRTASSGRNQGSQFYGCRNYPQCRETQPLSP